MNYEQEITAVAAETLALETVLAHVLGRIADLLVTTNAGLRCVLLGATEAWKSKEKQRDRQECSHGD